MPKPQRLATIKEASDYLGINSRTLRRRIADGTITGYRLGPKLIRVDLDEVETLLMRPVSTAASHELPDPTDGLLSADIRCLRCGVQILLLRTSLGWEHLQAAVAAQSLPAHHTCVSG